MMTQRHLLFIMEEAADKYGMRDTVTVACECASPDECPRKNMVKIMRKGNRLTTNGRVVMVGRSLRLCARSHR